MQMTTKSLISGYLTYATPYDLPALSEIDAPGSTSATPAILSLIGKPSVACGVAVSNIMGSIVSNIANGC